MNFESFILIKFFCKTSLTLAGCNSSVDSSHDHLQNLQRAYRVLKKFPLYLPIPHSFLKSLLQLIFILFIYLLLFIFVHLVVALKIKTSPPLIPTKWNWEVARVNESDYLSWEKKTLSSNWIDRQSKGREPESEEIIKGLMRGLARIGGHPVTLASYI